jgi:hypothetical protein
MSMKNSNDTIGNGTSDLPVSSATGCPSYYSKQLNGTHNKYVPYILMISLVYNGVVYKGPQRYVRNISFTIRSIFC